MKKVFSSVFVTCLIVICSTFSWADEISNILLSLPGIQWTLARLSQFSLYFAKFRLEIQPNQLKSGCRFAKTACSADLPP